MLTKFRSFIETAAWEGTRTKVVTDIDGISRIGTHLTHIFQNPSLSTPSSSPSSFLSIPPGNRILVLTSPTAGKRGMIVPHYLRKAGYIPLLCELPDSAPIANNVTAAVDVLRRVGGATMVIGFGSSAIQHTGRATACIATNGNKVKDYASNLGGKSVPLQPSLPYLGIPSCPTSNEGLRETVLLWEGQGLSSMKPLPTSYQSVLIDPKVMHSLDGLPAVNTTFSTLIHAIEGYLQTDSDTVTRRSCWLAIQLCLVSIPRIIIDPKHDIDGRLGLTFASTLVSLALARNSTLGPCRGISMTIASRYRIPYSHILSSITPEVLSSLAESIEETLEEAQDKDDEDDNDGEDKGNTIRWRDNFDDNDDKIVQRRKAWNPPTKFMQRPTTSNSSTNKGKLIGMKRNRIDNDSMIDDALLDKKLSNLSSLLDQEMSSRLTNDDHNEVNDIVILGKRLQHIIYLLERYKEFGGIGSKVLLNSTNTSTVPLPSIDKSIEFLSQHLPVPSSDDPSIRSIPLSRLKPLLYDLRYDICKGIGVPIPSFVKDYGLSDNELRNISIKAEIDDSILQYPVGLKSTDILDMLKHT